MPTAFLPRLGPATCAMLGLILLTPAVEAATTDISNVPLATGSASAALPNLMFILDDSGSMGWTYLPDHVNDSLTCKTRSGNSTNCQEGDPPYYASQNNGVYYNPTITYTCGQFRWQRQYAVADHPPRFWWTPSPARPRCDNHAVPRNGVLQDPRTMQRPPRTIRAIAGATDSTTATLATTTTVLLYPVNTANNPRQQSEQHRDLSELDLSSRKDQVRHTVLPHHPAQEHCSDVNLTTCTLRRSHWGVYPCCSVRWCTTAANANNTAVSGGSGPSCQAIRFQSQVPRYGQFKRVDIISGDQLSQGGHAHRLRRSELHLHRADHPSNWYAYYRTRMQMMKSAAGRAFSAGRPLSRGRSPSTQATQYRRRSTKIDEFGRITRRPGTQVLCADLQFVTPLRRPCPVSAATTLARRTASTRA